MSVSGVSASPVTRGMPLHCADVPEHCGMRRFPGLRPPTMATAKNRPLHLYEAPGEWPQTTPPPPEPPQPGLLCPRASALWGTRAAGQQELGDQEGTDWPSWGVALPFRVGAGIVR